MIARFTRTAVLAASLAAVPLLHAAEVAGVKVDEQIKVDGHDLILNGAGLRSKVFIKVYVGALYVTQKASAPAALIDAATPRRMTLRLLRDIDADTLYGALYDGLKGNHGEAELAALKPQIDQFAEIMKKIGNARSGDTVAIDFAADGVAVGFNGEVRGRVPGIDFARALLKVWLGEKVNDARLRDALLGRAQ